MRRRGDRRLSVFVFGAGKVGTALARALRARGAKTRLCAARKGIPRVIDADILVLAVRDRNLGALAGRIRDAGVLARRAVVVHVAGALDAEVLSPLRGHCVGVAQMHPIISFAAPGWTPDLTRGSVHVVGDSSAVARARRLARLLGMTPRTVPGLDAIAYHAAAGLVANGTAALSAVGAELLVRAGVTPPDAPRMLGPLLRSVAENVERLGFPDALTGPVRRGDVTGLERQLATLRAKLPEAVRLYVAAAEAQLPLARAIGDAPPENFDAIGRALRLTSP